MPKSTPKTKDVFAAKKLQQATPAKEAKADVKRSESVPLIKREERKVAPFSTVLRELRFAPCSQTFVSQGKKKRGVISRVEAEVKRSMASPVDREGRVPACRPSSLFRFL